MTATWNSWGVFVGKWENSVKLGKKRRRRHVRWPLKVDRHSTASENTAAPRGKNPSRRWRQPPDGGMQPRPLHHWGMPGILNEILSVRSSRSLRSFGAQLPPNLPYPPPSDSLTSKMKSKDATDSWDSFACSRDVFTAFCGFIRWKWDIPLQPIEKRPILMK